jgi:hypothetical protein
MSSPLDPETQEALQRLLQAETRRVKQQNFAWKAGAFLVCLVVGGYALAFLFILMWAGSGHSHADSSYATYNEQRSHYPLISLAEVQVGTKLISFDPQGNPPEHGEVTAKDDKSTTVRWEDDPYGHGPVTYAYPNETMAFALGRDGTTGGGGSFRLDSR